MKYDVVVVGGGLVGATVALALADAGLRIAIVEAKPPEAMPLHGEFDFRVSAITPVSTHILRNVGVWDEIPHERLACFREMHVWDEAGRGEIHFDSADVGLPTLGHIVENRVIQVALDARLANHARIKRYQPARVFEFHLESNTARVKIDDTPVTARLVIGADGARSPIREMAGIDVVAGEYAQTALVATIKPALSHRETAWQRFLSTGPLAFLPLPDDYVSIVWSTTPTDADMLAAMLPRAFCLTLADAFEHRLGEIEWVGERATFALSHSHAKRYVGERVALVGDAAHTIHPLAGQGVNLGLLDAAALAEVICDCFEANRDIGRIFNLRPYERARRGHNAVMRQAMGAFHGLFATDLSMLRELRNTGLALTDRFGALKRLFMTAASGYTGELPRLARPEVRVEDDVFKNIGGLNRR